jgi:hypothetical protein
MVSRYLVALATIACAVALAVAGHAGPDEPVDPKYHRSEAPVPGHYVVVLDDAVPDVAAEARAIASQYGTAPRRLYSHALKGFLIRLPEAAAIALSRHPRVRWVEEDGIVQVAQAASWGLDRIDQRLLPLDFSYDPGRLDGRGVRVYILDTGIRYTHVEFGGRAVFGTDVFGGDGSDCHGHGTHVAGTVAGATYGVARGATLVSVRVLDCSGSGTISGVIAGVDWITADHDEMADAPAVANMSLGIKGSSPALEAAIKQSIADGVTYVVAAGNSNADACDFTPARVPGAVTVAASGGTRGPLTPDERAWFSNWGDCVDVFAPGVQITSAWHTADSAINTLDGTSMAAPHVAGLAARYLQANPTAPPPLVWKSIKDTATTGVITRSRGSPNRLVYTRLGQALQNSGLEDSTGWTESRGGIITDTSLFLPRSGRYYALLRNLGAAGTDTLCQDVSIPTGSVALLHFFLRIKTTETDNLIHDTLRVQVRDPGTNAVLKTLATYSNLNASGRYVLRTLGLGAYRGRAVRLCFVARENASKRTAFLLDALSLTTAE